MWGWGPYSALLNVTPSAAPDQMAPVVTSVELSAGDVVFNWTAPNNNSAEITAYKIEILDQAGLNWQQETTDCDGTSPFVVGNRSCVIPMSVFYAAPFSLALDDLIVVRASAYNFNGWGPTSVPNTVGAMVRTVPTRMNAPARDPASTDT